VGLAVDASLARWQPARIAVGDGGQTRRADGAPNCLVAQVIDAEGFLALFLDRALPRVLVVSSAGVPSALTRGHSPRGACHL